MNPEHESIMKQEKVWLARENSVEQQKGKEKKRPDNLYYMLSDEFPVCALVQKF
jgi:hypothetical protein